MNARTERYFLGGPRLMLGGRDYADNGMICIVHIIFNVLIVVVVIVVIVHLANHVLVVRSIFVFRASAAIVWSWHLTLFLSPGETPRQGQEPLRQAPRVREAGSKACAGRFAGELVISALTPKPENHVKCLE